MPSSTVEDYLKAILLQEQGLAPGELVTMGQIASALEVAPGTVTAMVKTLEREDLVDYSPYSGVRLSDDGRRTATRVLRRHRLIELFLVEVLGLDWSAVHDEAERLEHAMSDAVIDRIDALLGHPRVDPHGDPIPEAGGELQPELSVCLRDCPAGDGFRVARVSDQDEDFLKFVERHGLKPGTRVAVEAREPLADAVTVRPHGGVSVTLGGEAAAKLWLAADADT
ncbi:MAG: metal-dependent transcriptional regulator [Acidobacteriota bacterium]